jgi:5-methylcytosine-specific restriction endonuclease McrA
MPRKGEWGQHHQAKMRRHYLAWNSHCVACGSGVDLQIDHIVPRLLGGSASDPGNWQTLCGTCNRIKGTSSMTPDQIREYRFRQRPVSEASALTISFLPNRRRP